MSAKDIHKLLPRKLTMCTILSYILYISKCMGLTIKRLVNSIEWFHSGRTRRKYGAQVIK
jgi:hypothetical protein